jgi:hypothetical protein
MKKLILLFTMIVGIGFVVNAQKPAEFKFASEVHDFGKIPLNKPVVYTFNFVNTGDAAFDHF